MSAEPSLEFLLARSIELAKESKARAVPRATTLAERLQEVHGRVERALTARDKRPHERSLTIEAELRDALQEWFDITCPIVGLPVPE